MLVGGEVGGESRLSLVEMGEEFDNEIDLGLGFLVAGLGFFFPGLFALIESGDVSKDEFGIDNLDVAGGVYGAEFMNNVVVFEAANDLHDGVDFTDGGEEFITESSSFGGSFDESGDVDEFDRSGDHLGRLGHLGELVQTRVGHSDHSDIGVNGAKRVVRGLGVASTREGIEEGGFSHVGHSYDSGLKHNAEALAQDGGSGNPQLTT